MSDRYRRTIYGKGYYGIGRHKKHLNNKQTKEYRLWVSMLKRCYSSVYQKEKPTYIGCKVSDRWCNFQFFCDDILLLEGYEEWNSPKKMHLDKDIIKKGNKLYCREFCKFVSPRENTIEASKTGLTYIATRIKDNYKEEFNVASLFADKYGLHSGHVNECIHGKIKTTMGWKIRIK